MKTLSLLVGMLIGMQGILFCQIGTALQLNQGTEINLDKNTLRDLQIWTPRLGANFDFGDAAKGIQAYAKTFHQDHAFDQSSLARYSDIVNWHVIGPIGDSTDKQSFASGKGIGRINRITFSPDYWDDSTVYAISTYGGVWRTTNDGHDWDVFGTDTQLPMTNVSDLAISSGDPNTLFICTGQADYGLPYSLPAQFSSRIPDNPLFTFGIYRGHIDMDGNITWVPINGTGDSGFLKDFEEGGTTQRIISRKHPQLGVFIQVFVATSNGIYLTNNGQYSSASVLWEKVLEGEDPFNPGEADQSLRGLAFHPTLPQTIYASGKDIYISEDYGDSWQSFTTLTGLDWHDPVIFGTCDFEALRINIDVSPANPDLLFAYVIGEEKTGGGCNSSGNKLFILRYDASTGVWDVLEERESSQRDAPFCVNYQRSPFAVFPEDPDRLYYGACDVFGATLGTNWLRLSSYSHKNIHADIHALAFPPYDLSGTQPFIMYVGHDGGISVRTQTNHSSNDNDFQSRSHGLENAKNWGFDDSEVEPLRYISALQDCGTRVSIPSSSTPGAFKWNRFAGGDGYAGQIDDNDSNTFYEVKNIGAGAGATLRFSQYKDNGNNSISNVFSLQRGSGNTNYPEENGGNEAFIPLSMQVKNHPTNGKPLFFLSETFQLNSITPAPFNWTRLTNYKSSGIPDYLRQNHASAISQTNPSYMYRARFMIHFLETPFLDLPTYPSVLFQTIDQSSCTPNCDYDLSTELIAALQTEAVLDVLERYDPIIDPMTGDTTGYDTITAAVPPAITGIAISPNDPEEIWVSFSGYKDNVKVWHSWLDSGGNRMWENADPNDNLDNLPVNDIAYQFGTNDRLFIATDAGIYTKEGTGSWTKYGTTLPNVRVVGIKINYCKATLLAATYGRGMWEANLPPIDRLWAEREITTSTVWPDEGVTITSTVDIRIKSGNTLTIKGTLGMPVKGRIIVEPRATLVVHGGRITNFCGEQWYGVQLEGDNSVVQTAGTGSLQGQIVLTKNTSNQQRPIIEHARNAIYTSDGITSSSTGGIILAEDAIFLNNRRSIEFLKYHSPAGVDNLSKLINCDFVVDDDFTDYDTAQVQVTMWEVDGIEFEGCHFKNEMTAVMPHGNRGAAIYALDTDFEVKPSTTNARNPYFEGWSTGIYGAKALFNEVFEVTNTTFKDNVTGIYAAAMNSFVATDNTFEIGGNTGTFPPQTSNNQFGLYIEGPSFGFDVSDNAFTNSQASATVSSSKKGIECYDLGSSHNDIHHNSFSSLDRANAAREANRDISGSPGLVYTCNTNSQNVEHDFWVEFSPLNDAGIAQFQESPNGMPTGNTFSLTCTFATSDFFNGANSIVYTHENNTGETPNCFSSTKISLNGITTSSNVCNTSGGSSRLASIPSDWEKQLQYYVIKIDSLKNKVVRLNKEGKSQLALYEAESDRFAYKLLYQFQKNNRKENLKAIRRTLSYINSLEADYAIASSFFFEKDFEAGLAFLDELPSKWELSNRQQQSWQRLRHIRGLQQRWEYEGLLLSRISQNDLKLLNEIEQSDSSYAGLIARNILQLQRPFRPDMKSPEYFEDGVQVARKWDVRLYPNPASDYLNVKIFSQPAQSTYQWKLYNMQGQSLKFGKNQNLKTFRIDTKELSNGIYFLDLEIEGFPKAHEKIVIVR